MEPTSEPTVPTRWYKPSTWKFSPWAKRGLTLVAIAVTVALVVKGYQKGNAYAQKVVADKSEKIGFSFTMANPPAWLPKQTISEIRSQIEHFSNRDDAMYRRFQNPLDKEVLQTVADYYTSRSFDGVDRQAVGSNAWIKRVLEVRRVIRQDRSEQWIEIYAEYRRPAAVVAVPVNESGARIGLKETVDPARASTLRYYLIDGEKVRLPGEYTSNPFASVYMTLYGIDQETPTPGTAWTAPEVAEGLKLAAVLQKQPYAPQISRINLSNFHGRLAALPPNDETSAQIAFDTAQGTSVRWGRPIGEERLHEVKASKKLATLTDLFQQFQRIDAGREWLDLRYGDPKVKALPRPEPATQPVRRRTGRP